MQKEEAEKLAVNDRVISTRDAAAPIEGTVFKNSDGYIWIKWDNGNTTVHNEDYHFDHVTKLPPPG